MQALRVIDTLAIQIESAGAHALGKWQNSKPGPPSPLEIA